MIKEKKRAGTANSVIRPTGMTTHVAAGISYAYIPAGVFLFLIFFKALIDNQLLPPALKGLVGVLAEMYLDGISSVPQLPLKTVGLLPVFGFYHIYGAEIEIKI